MGKRIQPNEKMKAALAASTQGAVDAAEVAIFETISLNTLPISQSGLFNGATTTQTTLQQMAAYVNGGGNVPLHTMHQQAEELPVGKTFMADVVNGDTGLPELRSAFYLPLSQTALIEGLETDVINEVSVGLKSQHINCSECGWDYLGADSTFMNIWDATCGNEHTVGVDGVHVILSGMDRWLEQSLVSLGAAKGARIQSRAKSLLGADTYEKLAASALKQPEITILHATHSMKKDHKMDEKEFLTQLTASSVNLGTANANLAAAQTSLTASQAENTALKAENATLKAAAVPPADVAALTVKLTAAEETTKKAHGVVLKEANRLRVILSLEAHPETTDIDALSAAIEADRPKVAEKLAPNPATAVLSQSTPAPSAFKERK